MTEDKVVCCPICQGTLIKSSSKLACSACGHVFQILSGIPDLRYPQPLHNNGLFLEKIDRITSIFDQVSFTELVSIYINDYPLSQTVKHETLQYYLTQTDRAKRMVDMFLGLHKELGGLYRDDFVLDLGCGSGGGAKALSDKFQHVYAIDADIIQLILAKKYFAENCSKDIQLICANSNALPFKKDQFSYIQAINVIEHLEDDLDPTLSEIHRCLKLNGWFAADSRNRYDIFMPDPHSGLRFIGFLPRKIIPGAVKRMTGNEYHKTRLLSIRELRLALARHFKIYDIRLPDLNAYGKPEFQWFVSLFGKNKILANILLFFISTLIVTTQKTID